VTRSLCLMTFIILQRNGRRNCIRSTKNDALSVRMWTEENRDCIFIYQEYELIDINAEPEEECTYTLGIQTEWQLQMMAYHGHKSAVSFDATFGTNAPRVPSTPIP
jgi:hypothetical protein